MKSYSTFGLARPMVLLIVQVFQSFSHLSDVYPSCSLSLRMSVTQVSDSCYGVESGILSQRVRDDLQRLGKGANTVCLHSC